MFNNINTTPNAPTVSPFSHNVGNASQYQGNDAGGGFYRPLKKKKKEQEAKKEKRTRDHQIDLVA